MFERGSPAHAGIDPKSRRVEMTNQGFPRTRGDRPFIDYLSVKQ